MSDVRGESKKQNGLKKVAGGCIMPNFMFIESNVEKTWMHHVGFLALQDSTGTTILSFFWLYRHNHLDPRHVSKAQAQVHVHTPAVAQDTMKSS